MLGKSSIVVRSLVLVLTILLGYHAVEAHEKVAQSKTFYKSFKQDVTGDQLNDTIELTGKTSKKNKQWVKTLKLTVKSNHQIISIPLKSGSHPKLVIGDMTHDGVKDVLITIKKHNIQYVREIYTFKDDQVTHIDLPPSVPMTAQFLDDYIAEISMEGQKTVKVDIKSHRTFYDNLGIYDHGKLNEATELIVNPYSKFTVSPSFGHGKGLLGKQKIKGIDGNDAIATISISWTYMDGEWKLQKVTVKPVKKKKYKIM